MLDGSVDTIDANMTPEEVKVVVSGLTVEQKLDPAKHVHSSVQKFPKKP